MEWRIPGSEGPESGIDGPKLDDPKLDGPKLDGPKLDMSKNDQKSALFRYFSGFWTLFGPFFGPLFWSLLDH